MFLLDTNIIMELIFNQPKADEVQQFLRHIPTRLLFISDFTLYSCGIRLIRDKQPQVFVDLITDLLIQGQITVLRIDIADLPAVAEQARQYGLVFDDAYQATPGEKQT